MTIPQSPKSTEANPDTDGTLALAALGWVLGEDARAGRLLSLTGLTPDILRQRLSERSFQAAVLEFLVNHEPDLLQAAEALEVEPQRLVAAQQRLGQELGQELDQELGRGADQGLGR